nr:LPD7 domain-containing protein [Paraburkholderia aspalathi]
MIRVSGRHEGVKQYLEEGQKRGRELGRDELDERVVLAGDLDVTDAIIQSIDTGPEVDRYLSITLSFKEDQVDRETLDAVVRDFEKFAFAAYRPDEYNFYAEAHLPRVKSYQDSKTGQLVERKPHIHIVIPKMNLISGQHMEPLGYVKSNIRFIDALQEHINAKHGLASPKDNRRVELTDASEMISRYKGDMFRDASRDLKESVLDAMLDRRIERYDDFIALLAERGETRLRNAGRDNEYPNVKSPDAAKGVNLKEHVFSRAFVELPTDEKLLQLSADVQPAYEIAGKSREDTPEIRSALGQWHETRALEVKYLNNGNTGSYPAYEAASRAERAEILAQRQSAFYARHLKDHHEPRSERPAGPGFDADEQRLRRVGRVYEFKRGLVPDVDGRFPRPEPRLLGTDGRSVAGPAGRGARPHGGVADRWEYGARPGPQGTPAAAVDGVRGMSGIPVVRVPQRRPVLLPDHARDQLEHERPVSPDGVRRHRDRSRAGRVRPTGRVADSALSQLTRDVRERQASAAGGQSEFTGIRQHLDARRLLAQLSHTHGVRPEKYTVTKGRDGGDRIRCGKRQLNVSDFLTKELNLPWGEASRILRDTWRQQVDGKPTPPAKELPRAALWREFTAARDIQLQTRRSAADAQRDSERGRREQIRDTFNARRDVVRADTTLRPSARRAAVSLARMERVSQETALREAISTERDAFKVKYGDPRGQSFSEYLQERAQAGDELALAELRRTRAPSPEAPAKEDNQILPVTLIDAHGNASAARYNEILLHAPALSWKVHDNGDVTYRHDDRDVVRDLGTDVRVLHVDRDAIEAGLRLAQSKFGNALELAGPEAFRVEAARVAADAGLYVEFTDDSLNRVMQERRAERIAQRAHDVVSRPPATEAGRSAPTAPHAIPDVGAARTAPSADEPTR